MMSVSAMRRRVAELVGEANEILSRANEMHKNADMAELIAATDGCFVRATNIDETRSSQDRDPPHHAPSPTTVRAATDECLARHAELDTYKNVRERYAATLEKTAGEPLTKRERFAMEFAKSLIYRGSPSYDVSVMIGAVELADDLIAELAKGRK